MDFHCRLDIEQVIRQKILNNLVMDENRKIYEKRHIIVPEPYYAATHDADGNEFGE